MSKRCSQCDQLIELDDNCNYFHLPPMLNECDAFFPFPCEDVESDNILEDLVRESVKLNYSSERMTELQEIRVTQFRSEELLLEKIYESLCRAKPEDGGWNECLDALWDIIQEHNDNNQWRLRK